MTPPPLRILPARATSDSYRGAVARGVAASLRDNERILREHGFDLWGEWLGDTAGQIERGANKLLSAKDQADDPDPHPPVARGEVPGPRRAR